MLNIVLFVKTIRKSVNLVKAAELVAYSFIHYLFMFYLCLHVSLFLLVIIN